MDTGLENRLDVEDYKKLHSLFLGTLGTPLSLTRSEFIEKAWSSIERGSKEEYGQLFDSVAVTQQNCSLLSSRDECGEDSIDWKGLTSFLLMQHSDKEEHAKPSNMASWKPTRSLTSPHPDPIHQVLYVQTLGDYLTVSKRGTLGLRSGKDLSLVRTHRLQNEPVRPKDLWVTDMVLLHNVHKLAVSFTTQELCFYDLLSKQEFSCQYKLQGFKFTPWCLDYWVDASNPDLAVLSIGDTGGQVSGICFTSAQISLFERFRPGSSSSGIIKWAELIQGQHHCCYVLRHQAHVPAWVRRVRFLGPLEAFVSCSISPENSLVVAWRENEGRALQVNPCCTLRGVADLDYHPGPNLIATAGVDHQVLLWNPYLTSKPVAVLRGHMHSVIAVRFDQSKNQLLSFSRDKVLCVWDVSSLDCTQRVAGMFPHTPEGAHMLLFLHEERQRLLLSSNSCLLLLQEPRRGAEQGRLTSHQHPVTCVLYNTFYSQVVSGDSASTVVCWMAETGRKVKQFDDCHGKAGISTMALNFTQTRLFTAGTNGEIKVWDFSGRCHYKLNAGLGQAVHISQILPLQRTILVMGWDRMLTVFRPHTFSKFFVEPSEWKGGVQHRDYVLCAAHQPPHTLVTGSYDGEIIVWSNSTEAALRKLRAQCQHGEDQTQQGHRIQCLPDLNEEQQAEGHDVITRLLFIPGRTSVAAATGGADLVSCGCSGVVRFWNTAHSQLLGQFTAHDKHLGCIIMAVSPCGQYLVTADKKGTLKSWDIEHYCLKPCGRLTNEPPKLISSLRPHTESVTYLETCIHGDRLFLLSASNDCSVALSCLPGYTVGVFGQEDPWQLERLEASHPGQNQGEKGGTDSPQNPAEMLSNPDPDVPNLNDAEKEIVAEEETAKYVSRPTSVYSDYGKNHLSRNEFSHSDALTYPDIGVFSCLRLGELQPLEEISMPDILTHPERYLSTGQANNIPQGNRAVKADEHGLFPKRILDKDKKHTEPQNFPEDRKRGIKNYQSTARGHGWNDRKAKCSTTAVSETLFQMKTGNRERL